MLIYLLHYLDSHKLFAQSKLNELVAFPMARKAYEYSSLFCLNADEVLFLAKSLQKESSILLFNHQLIFPQLFSTFEYDLLFHELVPFT